MTYINSFITASEDSGTFHSVVPQPHGERIPLHLIQYNLLVHHPYYYDHNSLIFEVYLIQKGKSADMAQDERKQLWDELFSKNHPCMRNSLLVTKYGFGVHYNHDGKMALYPIESNEYKQWAADPAIHKIKGMLTSQS